MRVTSNTAYSRHRHSHENRPPQKKYIQRFQQRHNTAVASVGVPPVSKENILSYTITKWFKLHLHTEAHSSKYSSCYGFMSCMVLGVRLSWSLSSWAIPWVYVSLMCFCEPRRCRSAVRSTCPFHAVLYFWLSPSAHPTGMSCIIYTVQHTEYTHTITVCNDCRRAHTRDNKNDLLVLALSAPSKIK